MARRHGLNAFERGAAPAERRKSEKVVEPVPVSHRPHRARGDERLDLGSEIDDVALTRPKQRTDADAISRQYRDAAREIHQHEGELTFEMGKQILAVFLIEMNDQLGVAVSAEHMPLGLELRPPLGEIEELSVADDRDGAVLIENRLAAVVHAHDAQSAMRKSNSRRKQETAIIRTAMHQRGRHAPHHRDDLARVDPRGRSILQCRTYFPARSGFEIEWLQIAHFASGFR